MSGSDRDFDEFSDAPQIIVKRADELTVERIRWLWQHHLARGKLHLIVGPPGVNKTTLWTAIVATLSTAGRWPDGTQASVGSSLIWSGEDGIQDTLLPRLMAHGADLAKVISFKRTATASTDGGRSIHQPIWITCCSMHRASADFR